MLLKHYYQRGRWENYSNDLNLENLKVQFKASIALNMWGELGEDEIRLHCED